MIFLKASPDLKSAFGYLVKSMGGNVTWNEIFAVTYNKIILPGNVRSTFFDFDTRKLYTNIIDVEIGENQVYEVAENELLANALNMTIYAFGKWGAIKGLDVEKDYNQLNTLFRVILKEVKIEPSFRDDHFQFWKDQLQLTYEDVLQEILKQTEGNEEEKGQEENGKEGEETAQEDSENKKKPSGDEEEYKLGLWHKIRWVSQSAAFMKGTQGAEDKKKARLGNDFYMVDYLCPACGEKLYIVLYPVNGEFLIDTDEGGVYLSRAYACGKCNRFFTPRPGKLLKEGEIYSLDFEEDRKAFEDYLELLGEKGTRQANYKFNQYASRRNSEDEEPETLSEALEEMDTMSYDDLDQIKGMMEDHFFPERETQKYRALVKNRMGELQKEKEQEIGGSGNTSGKKGGEGAGIASLQSEASENGRKYGDKGKNDIGSARDKKKDDEAVKNRGAEGIGGVHRGDKLPSSQERPKPRRQINYRQDFTVRTIDELRSILQELLKQREDGSGEKASVQEREKAVGRVKNALYSKLKAKYDARMKILDRMQAPALRSLKETILSEVVFSEDEKGEYSGCIDQVLFRNAGDSLQKKVESARGKNYRDIARVIEAVKGEDAPEAVKDPMLEMLEKWKMEQGEKELEQMFSHLPPITSRKQLDQLYLDLKKYEDINVSPYEALLDKKRDSAEKREISDFVRHSNKKDRKALQSLYDRLMEQDFKEENVAPFLDKIHDKIYELDQRALSEICPDVMSVGFDEGLEAYEKISSGAFLPELKIDMLKMLDKRLTMLKTGESGQLARKLKKELEAGLKDTSRFHYYDARRMLKGEEVEEEDLIIQKALSSYVPERNAYEYPIVICDSSRSGNGKEGFVLTPDHIFYGSLLNSGAVRVFDVDDVFVKGGMLGKGVFLKMDSGDKVKLPNGVPQKEWEDFAEVFRSFLDYLKEKPESRNISYLAKDKHEEKCCYRCGFVFTGGDVCPKCGSKANR